jgi:glycosyltransferase involved in cell wall biosynthesis
MTEKNTYPKVSIIIPTFNRAGLIMETIESIRQQTYTNWELIIVDDGSDDDTEEIISKVNEQRMIFIKAERTGIGGRNKNIGIKKASGDLIAFNDSDDLWDRTKLEKQVIVLQQHPEAGFSVVNGYNFREKGKPVDFFYKEREGLKVGDAFISFFQSELAGFTQALLLRKECFEKTGLFKEERSFSDIDFIVSLAAHFKAAILYEPLVFRRLHDSNYIHPNWEKSYEEGIDLIRSNKTKLPPVVYSNALFRVYMNYGEKYLSYKKRTKAIMKFWKGWGYKPFSIVPLKKIIKSILHLK